MAVLTIVNASGHTVLEYDKTDADDIAQTRQKFNEIIADRGYVAYTDRGDLTVDFDPEADNITMAPIITAG